MNRYQSPCRILRRHRRRKLREQAHRRESWWEIALAFVSLIIGLCTMYALMVMFLAPTAHP